MLLLLLIIFIIVLIAIDRCLYCVFLFDLYFIDLSLFFLIVFSSFRPPSPLPPSPARTHTSPLKQWRVKACVCCNYKAFATPRMEILVVYLYLSSCFYGFFFGDSCIHFFSFFLPFQSFLSRLSSSFSCRSSSIFICVRKALPRRRPHHARIMRDGGYGMHDPPMHGASWQHPCPYYVCRSFLRFFFTFFLGGGRVDVPHFI